MLVCFDLMNDLALGGMELVFMPQDILSADIYHALHLAAIVTQQENIACAGGHAHKDVANAAPH